MNVLLISPKNRGVGLTTLAFSLAAELDARGEFAQVIDLNEQRPSLYRMTKNCKLDGDSTPETSLQNVLQLIRTGTISPEDMMSTALDVGGVKVIPIISDTLDTDMIDFMKLTKTASYQGKRHITIIDCNVDDMNSNLFKQSITLADVVCFVMTQDFETSDNIGAANNLNDKALRDHGIKTMYVVNKYSDACGDLKSIFSKMAVVDKKSWFKVRYNTAVSTVKAKHLYVPYAEALHKRADEDVVRMKSDIAKVADFILKTVQS